MKHPEKLYIDQAAAFVGLSRQTLYNYRNAGKGPACAIEYVGRRKRLVYRREDLERYAQERQAKRERVAERAGKRRRKSEAAKD